LTKGTSPLAEGHYPLFGLDLWEHSYFRDYTDRRKQYALDFWHVINWDFVAQRVVNLIQMLDKNEPEQEDELERNRSKPIFTSDLGSTLESINRLKTLQDFQNVLPDPIELKIQELSQNLSDKITEELDWEKFMEEQEGQEEEEGQEDEEEEKSTGYINHGSTSPEFAERLNMMDEEMEAFEKDPTIDIFSENTTDPSLVEWDKKQTKALANEVLNRKSISNENRRIQHMFEDW